MTDREKPSPDPATVAAAFGVAEDMVHGAVAPPLYMSSTYEFAGYDQPRLYDYGRGGNPTRDLLAEALAKLEGGAGAVITSSGMAALDLLIGRLNSDQLVIAPHDCYGGTMRLLKARSERKHCKVEFIDQSDETAVGRALDRSPALLLIETPSNPLMRVVDIALLSARAKRAGATVAVDNTFLSPAIQRPISLGANFVIHSTTKYLNGHSDVIGGAVVCANTADVQKLRHWANVVGSAGAPFDSWLTLRGMRTLHARIRIQQENAMVIAKYLDRHPLVSCVHYPGLASHPGNRIALSQQDGFGAMLSFELAGGLEAIRAFITAVRFFTLAESLGGVESLVAHPATMTHADMGADARKVAGISDGLLRLSVGLEAVDDLIDGLESGLNACRNTSTS